MGLLIVEDEKTNSTPAEVLVGNLLKNAFTHNLAGGDVLIKIDKKAIQIDNTGPEIREKVASSTGFITVAYMAKAGAWAYRLLRT